MRIAFAGTGALFLAALCLAACGEPPGGEMGNDPEGAKGGDVQIEPGLYRMQITLGGMGPDGTGSQFADDQTCLTEEDVKGGNREMLLNMQGRDACEFERYELDGSKLDAVLVCAADQTTPKSRATIAGTVTPTKSDLTLTVTGFSDGQGQGVDASGGVSMQVVSERVGDCAEGGE